MDLFPLLTSIFLNFGFSSLRALFLFVCLFLSPIGSVERKGSSPLSLCVPVGSEQSCQARASPWLCPLDAKADACVPLGAHQPSDPSVCALPWQTVSSWLSHLCHILCSVSPPGRAASETSPNPCPVLVLLSSALSSPVCHLVGVALLTAILVPS